MPLSLLPQSRVRTPPVPSNRREPCPFESTMGNRLHPEGLVARPGDDGERTIHRQIVGLPLGKSPRRSSAYREVHRRPPSPPDGPSGLPDGSSAPGGKDTAWCSLHVGQPLHLTTCVDGHHAGQPGSRPEQIRIRTARSGPGSASRRECREWTDVEGTDRSVGQQHLTGLGCRDRARRGGE